MDDQPDETEPVEFSRLFRLAEFSEALEHDIEIIATDAECSALVARYSLLSLTALSAQLSVRQDILGEIIVEGTLKAELAQPCVVTLDLVRESISGQFDQRYTLKPPRPEADSDGEFEDLDPPEPVIGDSIDLGELVAQYLSLSINPYPRAPDADTEADQLLSNIGNDGPFAALAKLRK